MANLSSSDTSTGESSRANTERSQTRTLADAMRAPSTSRPEVMVLDVLPNGLDKKEQLNPNEDLWLSTADGRYSSPMIPLVVGSEDLPLSRVPGQAYREVHQETFYVHKHVLMKSEYFQKALTGAFRESECQTIVLPEEDPALFHFLIAYLYEGKYDPIKPIASALTISEVEKGKSKDTEVTTGAESDSDASVASFGSDFSAHSRRRRERYRRREERHLERMRQKHPGVHRPSCNCPQCIQDTTGPPCWHCAAPRMPPPPAPVPHHPVVVVERDGYHRVEPARRRHRHRPGDPVHLPPPPPPPGWMSQVDVTGSDRIAGEDLRTWLMAYELHLDVYILANKFLLDGFKQVVARVAIDMLETAGADAAMVRVLKLCQKLYEGLSESDPLLKMIFARVGFLQPWRRDPDEANRFLVEHPDIASLLLREMAARREEDYNGRTLPSMERCPPFRQDREVWTPYRPPAPYRAMPRY